MNSIKKRERSALDELCFTNIDLKFIGEGGRDWYMIVKRIKFSQKQCLLWAPRTETE